MRLLVDESLQHELARILTKAGHVTDLDLNGAPDNDVLAAAADTGRIVVTADTDFGTLLALSNAARPSVILLRHRDAAHPSDRGTDRRRTCRVVAAAEHGPRPHPMSERAPPQGSAASVLSSASR